MLFQDFVDHHFIASSLTLVRFHVTESKAIVNYIKQQDFTLVNCSFCCDCNKISNTPLDPSPQFGLSPRLRPTCLTSLCLTKMNVGKYLTTSHMFLYWYRGLMITNIPRKSNNLTLALPFNLESIDLSQSYYIYRPNKIIHDSFKKQTLWLYFDWLQNTSSTLIKTCSCAAASPERFPGKGRKKDTSCDSPLSGWLSTSIESKQREKSRAVWISRMSRCSGAGGAARDFLRTEVLRGARATITTSVRSCLWGTWGRVGGSLFVLRVCMSVHVLWDVYLWLVQCNGTTQSFLVCGISRLKIGRAVGAGQEQTAGRGARGHEEGKRQNINNQGKTFLVFQGVKFYLDSVSR